MKGEKKKPLYPLTFWLKASGMTLEGWEKSCRCGLNVTNNKRRKRVCKIKEQTPGKIASNQGLLYSTGEVLFLDCDLSLATLNKESLGAGAKGPDYGQRLSGKPCRFDGKILKYKVVMAGGSKVSAGLPPVTV